jgi:hypothetical protein
MPVDVDAVDLGVPPLLTTRPARMLISVDLPAPLGPRRPKMVPRGTSRSTPKSASLAGWPFAAA